MTYPRSHLVDPNGGFYHVYSRCVRKAYLCGRDPESGYDFDHRRQWIEDRLLMLASVFAIEIFGYAVMSNHYHLVVKISAKRVKNWSDDEIIDKWLKLNPRKDDNINTRESRKQAIQNDKDRLQVLRDRLASLSWFMRYLNEPLARIANMEDGCTGRFWEGRFKSQRLLDERAILACMIYVDLNPVRAGLTDDPTHAEHTSLAKRVNGERDYGKPMRSMGIVPREMPFSYSLDYYIQLTKWTLEVQQSSRPNRFGGFPPPDVWIRQYLPKPGCWQRAQGSIQSLKEYAKELGQCWIKTSTAFA